MADDPKIDDLVERVLDEGLSPAEVCRDAPELTECVTRRVERIRALERQMDVLLPSTGDDDDVASSSADVTTIPELVGYRIDGVLGRGGVGVVYAAHHLALDRDVALKMLLSGPFAAPTELARFRREAEVLAALRHPNIIQVHDVGMQAGRAFFTMERADGGSLEARLARAPIPAAEAARLAADIADAVQAAHSSGIVHRDLKPSNILLTGDGVPKISDFGLAARVDRQSALTLSRAPMGTPGYMSPEQAAGSRDVGPPADIHAVGAILYTLLARRPPFSGATTAETLTRVLGEDPLPPSTFDATIPRDLETICLVCMRKEPRRRYASAGALADDLRRFARGDAIAARRTGLLERLLRWMRRRPALAVALLTVMLSGIVLTANFSRIASERSATLRAASLDLDAVEEAQRRGRGAEATAALERACARLDGIREPTLEARIRSARARFAFIIEAENIRLRRGGIVEGTEEPGSRTLAADAGYAQAFRDAGLPDVDTDSVAFVAAVSASPIRRELVAALDDWAYCAEWRPANDRAPGLLDAAKSCDPGVWRDRIRDAARARSQDELTELGRCVSVVDEPVSLLLALANRLGDGNHAALDLLVRIQAAHPSDFWANYELAHRCGPRDSRASLRFHQAAVALRPDSGIVRANLGTALASSGDLDAGERELRRAIALDPTIDMAKSNLGNVLLLRGRREEAIAMFREALGTSPRLTSAWNNLGKVFADERRFDEASAAMRNALEIDPNLVAARVGLGVILHEQGKIVEAIAEYERAAATNPDAEGLDMNFGRALLAAGRGDEAIAHHRRAIERNPLEVQTRYNLVVALSTTGRRYEERQELRRTLEIDPKFVPALHSLGLQRNFAGDHAGAERILRSVLEIDPYYVNSLGSLILVLQATFALDEAEELLPRFIHLAADNEKLSELGRILVARSAHLRELEREFPIIVDGVDDPENATDALELVGLASRRSRHDLAVRLYEFAFAARPSLESDFAADHRARAAAVAVEASTTATDPSEMQRKALGWLSASQAVNEHRMKERPSQYADFTARVIDDWRGYAGLRRTRDTDYLESLPEEFRFAWRELWWRIDRVFERALAEK